MTDGVGQSSGQDQRLRALLAEQVKQQARPLFNLAYRVLHDAQAAEDACQQAFLNAWRHRRQIHDTMALRAWLMKTVMNECLTRLRRGRVEKRAQQVLTRTQPDKLTHDQRTSLRESVAVAMLELAEPTRTIVALRLIEGRSGVEVSRMVGCSQPEVSRRLHLGMHALRQHLHAWME